MKMICPKCASIHVCRRKGFHYDDDAVCADCEHIGPYELFETAAIKYESWLTEMVRKEHGIKA